MTDSVDPEQPEFQIPDERVDTVYSVVASRRTAFDTMMWQVPALGLAAQAFLLTIAYGGTSSDPARVVAGLLSVIVALVAIQTMLKHRSNEKTDNLILERIEQQVGIRLDAETHPHDEPFKRGEAIGNDQIHRAWVKLKSVRLWLASLSGFAAAGAFAVLLTLCDPTILQGGAG